MGSPSRSTIPDINDSINPNNNGNTAKSPRSISKKLHYLNIAGLIPCWALGLPLLIIDASIWSILAFIWSTLSSLTSLYRVCEKKKTHEYQIRLTDDGDEPKRKNYMGLWACVDFVLGGGVMSWAIITFTQQSGRRGTAFLLAYVSMVWFAQSFLHIYLLYGYLKFGLGSLFKRSGRNKKGVLCQRCRSPVCQDESHEPSLGKMAEGAGRGREALV